uniref:Uncharacterized protein n=1 Tax=Anguilla anguilla TaxID=7936 RepID=A0A0E9PL06_ANGAN
MIIEVVVFIISDSWMYGFRILFWQIHRFQVNT